MELALAFFGLPGYLEKIFFLTDRNPERLKVNALVFLC